GPTRGDPAAKKSDPPAIDGGGLLEVPGRGRGEPACRTDFQSVRCQPPRTDWKPVLPAGAVAPRPRAVPREGQPASTFGRPEMSDEDGPGTKRQTTRGRRRRPSRREINGESSTSIRARQFESGGSRRRAIPSLVRSFSLRS